MALYLSNVKLLVIEALNMSLIIGHVVNIFNFIMALYFSNEKLLVIEALNMSLIVGM